MVIRTWRGSTTQADADRYLDYLKDTGLKEYRRTPGNQGVFVLRRSIDDRAEFLLISLWDSIEAVRAFAGPNHDKAVFYPKDNEFLVEFDRDVRHYDVLVKPD